MHGRVKVRTDAEKAAIEEKKNEEKAAKFRAGAAAVFQMRNDPSQDQSALQLTAQLLSVNPDFYTLWNYRREILSRNKDRVSPDASGGEFLSEQEFDALCQQELDLSAVCLLKNAKSYPTWYHRCCVMQSMFHPDFEQEVRLCDAALLKDCRNFHCWNYRRFVVAASPVDFQKEMDFTETKIRQNFSNFSAWFQRSTLLTEAASREAIDMKAFWDKEYRLVENAIFTDPTDQSAWFYHKWLSSIQLGDSAGVQAPRHTDLRVEQILWNKDRHFLVICFNRAFDSCPDVQIQLSDEVLRPFVDSREDGTGELRSSFIMEGSSGTSITIWFRGSRFVMEGDAAILVKTSQARNCVTKQILKNQNLLNLKQLHDLEPENKWVNLALTNFEEDVQLKMEKLAKIDPCRSQNYMDILSDQRINRMIDQISASCTAILKDQSLTCINSCHRMSHIRFLDLSKNRLTVLTRSFNDLHCMETLLLADNDISLIVKGFEAYSLRTLSLINNKVQSVNMLRRLDWCRNLRVVYLCGNPCTRSPSPGNEVWNWEEGSPDVRGDESTCSSIQPLETMQ